MGAPRLRGALSAAEIELLLTLLELPTAGPLETGLNAPIGRLWAAQRAYAQVAASSGLECVHHAPATAEEVDRPDVPAVVRRALAADPGFLAGQPNLVLRLGSPRPHRRTLMFNVHLDTVAGAEPTGFDGNRFTGRGAIDAKGPGVALLAGIRTALAADPTLPTRISVLIQAVAGEEGGALGTVGTRPLVERGYHGRLNVFCEPTSLRCLTRCTAAMTARLTVAGDDAVDDRPHQGHNATVLLGFLAQHLAHRLDGYAPDGQVCVAGLQTGPLHNRVYGSGDLLLNLAYRTTHDARRLEADVVDAVRTGLAEFSRRFAATRGYARTAADAAEVLRVSWDKRALPTLDGADAWAEALLCGAVGLDPWPTDEPAFTCDAIWLAAVPDTATVILGPGSLDANHAHARGEFADRADLDAFADRVARLVLAFADDCDRADQPARPAGETADKDREP